MILYTVSIHSGSPEQNAAVVAEMERALGYGSDPLFILIAEEEGEFDQELACRWIKSSLPVYVKDID